MERLAHYVITAAGPGDAAELARVHVAAWRESYAGLLPARYLAAMEPLRFETRWRRQLTRAPMAEAILLAEGRDGAVGYCAGALVGTGLAEVSTLYLLRAAQGHGLGRRLLGGVARVLKARGATSLRLWVLRGNDGAAGFYRRLGGVPGAHRPVRGWGDGHEEQAYAWADIETLIR
ncbi:MAG: GNAT family N-acetyltransferase [Caulobacteraceae bacterium]|nr:GNAT family N-acetyltransferase [Caulobacteraceae bacterium]